MGLRDLAPPVNGFWFLTMYDADRFFVPNPLNRYTLSQRDNLTVNADGSVDIYLQADLPGAAKETNWLPAPKAKFSVMLRLYWPKATPPSILDGTWSRRRSQRRNNRPPMTWAQSRCESQDLRHKARALVRLSRKSVA